MRAPIGMLAKSPKSRKFRKCLLRKSVLPAILSASVLTLTVASPGCGSSSSGPGVTANGDGGGADAGPDRHVVVLFTSDEHSHVLSFSPELDDYPQAASAGAGPLVGGVARRSTLVAELRKAAADAGKDSLLVSAGDNQMGALPMLGFTSTSVDYGAMAALGYDATTLGNHELDFGPKALAQSISSALAAKALPPIVASNIHFSATDPGDDDLAALAGTGKGDKPLEPYRVLVTKSGVKVGLLGFVGINAAHVAPNKTPVAFSAPVDPKTDGDLPTNLPALYKDLQPVVDTLRNVEKVDLVVALSHAGIRDLSTAETTAAGEDPSICQNVSGIDLIVSGHAHQRDPKPITVTNTTTAKPCLVLNGGAYGQEVGTVDFTIPGDASKGVSWDAASQKMVPVNEGVAPDPAWASKVDTMITGVEAANASGTTLSGLLSHALAQSITDDPGKVGDLYFKPLAQTDFDVTATHPLVWLSADAMLAQADALVTETMLPATDVAIESAGVIRNVLKKGKTGTIAAADAFAVVPLGASPATGSLGYPLIRGFITRTELRAVVELALAAGPTNSDYDLGLAGLKIEYDRTRPPLVSSNDLIDKTKGMVTRMWLDTNHADGFEQYDTLIYENGVTGQFDFALISVVTSSYIGQFAGDAGVAMKDANGVALPIKSAILSRKDASEVKQAESFMRYLHVAPGGKLPTLYDATSADFTKRAVCTKGC